MAGSCGIGPASAINTFAPSTCRPVGTMFAYCATSLTSPARSANSSRLWCPSVTRNPSPYGTNAYCTPLGTKKSASGGFSIDQLAVSAMSVVSSTSSTR